MCYMADFFECFITQISEKYVIGDVVRHVQVWPAVFVEIAPGGRETTSTKVLDAGL